ncbi:MAG: DUF1622 domain-containing protein [Patescibacteria group bacterium]
MLTIIIEGIATVIATFGTIIIVYGVVKSIISFVAQGLPYHDESKKHILDHISLGLGRHLILGLEFFIASDIINITINPGWNELGQLTVVIILRTILSFFLTREIHLISIDHFKRK